MTTAHAFADPCPAPCRGRPLPVHRADTALPHWRAGNVVPKHRRRLGAADAGRRCQVSLLFASWSVSASSWKRAFVSAGLPRPTPKAMITTISATSRAATPAIGEKTRRASVGVAAVPVAAVAKGASARSTTRSEDG